MISCDRITIIAHEGILSVGSFGNTENFRIPAYIVKPGQAYLENSEWRLLIHHVNESTDNMVDIEIMLGSNKYVH